MKHILLSCLFSLLSLVGYTQGQVYPVQSVVNLLPPYSLYLSDYVSGSRERLVVTLLNRDVQYPSMPVRLRLTIKGSGFTMQTRPYASVSQITLEPNVPYKLTIDDLRPYFDTRNLSAQGLGGDSYLKGGRLPEGMIEFGVEVLEYGTSKVLSQRAMGTAWLSLQKPPVLSLPFNGETVPWREPLNVMFQWTPQHSGVARVEYELIVKELWDNGLAPESAFAYSPEIFRERVSSTSYLYGPMAPPLEPGRRYAWAVRVVAKDGADDVNIFQNDGLSVIRSFRITRSCPEPVQVKASPERGYINVEWEGSPDHLDYTISYRLKGSEEWSEVHSSFPSAMLPGVRPGNTYEYRVGGYCEPGLPAFAPVGSITLPSEDTSRLRNCGILRPVDLSNQESLVDLQAGDRFMAGDFPVNVLEATGSQGYFTGTGYVHVPFLAFAPFKVTFDNVCINTDRRMIRGVVKTVYDPSESGVTNLDDIFTGGSNTGKVIAGITKTDLSADFVIGQDADFFYDETTGQLEVRDEGGQVLGYIEVGTGGTGSDEAGGDNGNEPSVFPMTVKDQEGNIYQVDEAPGDSESDDSEGDASAAQPKKKLVVTPVGKGGDALKSDEVNFKQIDRNIAEVTFTDTEGSLYAFDSWKDIYSRSYLIRGKYEQIGQDYHVPAKLIPSGKTDKVGAVIKMKDATVDPEKVVFRTSAGTEFKCEKYEKSTGRYTLSIVGGKSNDGQELYALYPKRGGGYYTLGKLLIVSYPWYQMKVKIVPVANEFTEFDALRSELQKIYSRVGIECVVEKLPVFDYAAPLLFQEKSGLFGAYNDEMKKLNAAFSAQTEIDPEAGYLFILLFSGQGDDRNYSGMMPLNQQFGYLFRRDFDSFGKFAVAAAHELAHGRLSLRHPFDKSLGLAEGDVAENLMDYRDGKELAKWQWDVIHDPGVVMRIFERDKDGMSKTGYEKLVDILQKLRCAYASGRTKLFLSMNTNPEEYSNIKLNDVNYTYVNMVIHGDKNGILTLAGSFPLVQEKALMYRGTFACYDFGGIELYIPLNNKNAFESYMQNPSFNVEYDELSGLLREGNIDRALDKLYNYSYCIYERLTLNERKMLLKGLAERSFLSENYEEIVLNLLRSESGGGDIPSFREMLSYIFETRKERTFFNKLSDRVPQTLYECFCRSIDDFGGNPNYSLFIKELAGLYTYAYKEELKQSEGGIIQMGGFWGNLSQHSPLFVWSGSGGKSVKLYNGCYNFQWSGGVYEGNRSDLSPLEIVRVCFNRDFSFFTSGERPVITMPAFMLAYLLNYEQNNLEFDFINYVVSAFSLGKSVVNLADKKYLSQKLIASLGVLQNAVSIVMTDEAKEWIEKEFGSLGSIFRQSWENYERYELVKGGTEGAMNLMMAKNWLSTFESSWNIIYQSESAINKIGKDNIGKINTAMSDLKSLLEHEGIIY